MLRSEHVPFNFFGPLALDVDGDLTWSLIKWIAPDMEHVDAVRIEHAPEEATALLADNTSFDVFVEYSSSRGAKCALGIEVKYTEGPYGYGARERTHMFASDSAYHQLTEKSCLYEENALLRLRRTDLKQLWRNHLLGSALNLHRFRSVLLYPRGNLHAAKAANEYRMTLRPERQHEFVSLTFEEWLSAARGSAQCLPEVEWIAYLSDRYDVRVEPHAESLERVPALVVPIKLCVPPGSEAEYPASAAASRLDRCAMPDRASVRDMVRLAYAMDDGYRVSEVLGFGDCADLARERSEQYTDYGRYNGLASELWCCLFFEARSLRWTDYPGMTEDEYKPQWDALYEALVERLRADDGSVLRLGEKSTRWLGYGGAIASRAARRSTEEGSRKLNTGEVGGWRSRS
jgi:hypothetical protein